MSQVTIAFSGQGSQFVGMGHDFFNADNAAKLV